MLVTAFIEQEFELLENKWLCRHFSFFSEVHWDCGVWQATRKSSEHLVMGSYKSPLGIRAVPGKSVLMEICTSLEFDIVIHGPHHRYPCVVHDQLGKKMDDNMRENLDVSFQLVWKYWLSQRLLFFHQFIDLHLAKSKQPSSPSPQNCS